MKSGLSLIALALAVAAPAALHAQDVVGVDGTVDERIADLNVQFRMGKVETALDDKQGRIRVESHLLAYAGIDKDVVVVGVGRYFRLMAK